MDTSFFSDINWLHVFVATLAYYALGAIWYSFLFQKKWIEYQKIDVNDPGMKQGVAGVMITAFIVFFIITAGLAILVDRLELHQLISGVKLGLFTGFFFSATVISITYLYTKKPFGLHAIDGLFHIIGQMIAAAILCLWR
jgi:hypothetical protein